MVNNEIGTIQPIKEIGAIVRKYKGVYFHTDAAQAVGKSQFIEKEARMPARPDCASLYSYSQSPSMLMRWVSISCQSRVTRSTDPKASAPATFVASLESALSLSCQEVDKSVD